VICARAYVTMSGGIGNGTDVVLHAPGTRQSTPSGGETVNR
jgi:hypothetical protein